MADKNISGPRPVSRQSVAIQKQRMEALAKKMLGQEIRQVATEKSFQSWAESGFNIVKMRNFKTLEEHKAKKEKGEAKGETVKTEDGVEAIKNIDGTASRFNSNNPELETRILIALRNSIKDTDSIEDILKKVLDFYPDLTLADEALDFLIQTSHGALGLRILQAKELLNARFEREIKAGKNIASQAKEFSKAGLGTPTSLRNIYRDITGNPRTPVILFDELSDKFTYENMKTVISFLLHSLGADLKAKGPSISRGELHRLVNDTRSLQAILGVFRFFKSRMGLILSQFKMNQLSLPTNLDFETIAKNFVSLLSERYITVDKILKLARLLNLSEEIIAQIIIFTQMRDAVRQISPRLYKNHQQKEDLLTAILEALEELEEEVEEDDDDDDDDES
jgi:type III secretion protein W